MGGRQKIDFAFEIEGLRERLDTQTFSQQEVFPGKSAAGGGGGGEVKRTGHSRKDWSLESPPLDLSRVDLVRG